MEGIFVDLICRSVPHCSDTGEHPEKGGGAALLYAQLSLARDEEELDE
jgi:hypothetical protein